MKIESNKRKLYIALIACVFIAFCCVQLIIDPEKFSRNIFRGKEMLRVLGIIGTVFLVFGVTRIFARLKKGNAALIIDEIGITDPFLTTQTIKWSNIKDIRRHEVMSEKLLLIDVETPHIYFENFANKSALGIMKSNMKIYGTPIALSPNFLKCSFDELEDAINIEFIKYKN